MTNEERFRTYATNAQSHECFRWAVAEIDRLRAALAVFANMSSWDQYEKDCFEWCRDYNPVDFARRELEGQK